ncbi:MAG: ATP-binding protein [Cyanobacteria bacterium CRU_2_1]|nr:ATP-binding protein [Cyanobacteria bacterium CRU_2_1]
MLVVHSETPFQNTPYQRLNLESTLRDLPLFSSEIEASCLGKEVARFFDANPLLPGVVLTAQRHLVGMISRQRFLEQMGRPYGLALFLNRSIKTLYAFVCTEFLTCSGGTPIMEAARLALRRSPELRYEPIVVELAPQEYRLLDFYELLVAQSQIHELAKQLLHERTQSQIIQTEKMASLGRIVANVAHEILNPVNFISGNLNYLSNYTQELIELVNVYESEMSESTSRITEVKEDIDLEFLLQDLPTLINSLKMGSDRLKDIVGGLRNFSHMDEARRKPMNIHDCLNNTLLILNNRLKDIEVVKNYGNLPPVNCYSGQLSQVFMNLISNAADALLEKFVSVKAALLDRVHPSFVGFISRTAH